MIGNAHNPHTKRSKSSYIILWSMLSENTQKNTTHTKVVVQLITFQYPLTALSIFLYYYNVVIKYIENYIIINGIYKLSIVLYIYIYIYTYAYICIPTQIFLFNLHQHRDKCLSTFFFGYLYIFSFNFLLIETICIFEDIVRNLHT